MPRRMESRPGGIEGKALSRQGCLDSQAEEMRLCSRTRKAGQVSRGPESVRKVHLAMVPATGGKDMKLV